MLGRIEVRFIDVCSALLYILTASLLFFLMLFSSNEVTLLIGLVIGLPSFLMVNFLIGYKQANIDRCYKVILICNVILVPVIFFIGINLPDYPYFPMLKWRLGDLGTVDPDYHLWYYGSLESYTVVFFGLILLYDILTFVFGLIISGFGGSFTETK